MGTLHTAMITSGCFRAFDGCFDVVADAGLGQQSIRAALVPRGSQTTGTGGG